MESQGSFRRRPFLEGPAVTWSEDYDLTKSIAFMRALPVQYTDQLYGVRDIEAVEEYLEAFVEDLQTYFGDYLSSDKPFRAQIYQVPPNAGPDLDFIVMVVENVDHILQTLESYLSLGGHVLGFLAKRSQVDAHQDDRYDSDYPGGMYMTISMAEALCLRHAHEKYYDPKMHPSIKMSSYARSVFIGAVDHPAPGVKYVVTISIGSVKYLYVVQANGEVLEHFRLEGNQIAGLHRPNWNSPEVGYLGDEITGLPDHVFDDSSSY